MCRFAHPVSLEQRYPELFFEVALEWDREGRRARAGKAQPVFRGDALGSEHVMDRRNG